jgi:hypothetical protein
MAERTLKTIMTQTDDLKSRPKRFGPRTPAEKLSMLVFAAAQMVNCGIRVHHFSSARSWNKVSEFMLNVNCSIGTYLFRNRFGRSSFDTVLDQQLLETLGLGPRPQCLSGSRVLPFFIHLAGISILLCAILCSILADIAFRL